MKLSEYAKRHDIQYRAAWNRYKAGRIPGAYQDEMGAIIVPDDTKASERDAVIYARVSDPSKRKTQLPAQQKRMEDWAVANGYRVVAVLLQCLFDRFGSVFPQCGLMVFPGVVIVSR